MEMNFELFGPSYISAKADKNKRHPHAHKSDICTFLNVIIAILHFQAIVFQDKLYLNFIAAHDYKYTI